MGHHSLVTPIDWKLLPEFGKLIADLRRHSLVTPIDWKLILKNIAVNFVFIVATRWRHLLIGNYVTLSREVSDTNPSPLAGDTY